MTKKINVNDKWFYEYNKPEKTERTNSRLKQLVDLGIGLVGNGEFGVDGVVSGLYIEKVWSYEDKDWDDYIEWMVSVIDKKA